MAAIHIKGRQNPILISNDRAVKIKSLWVGDLENNINPISRQAVLDLGEWCGEYGQIKSIDVERVRPIGLPEPEELPLTEHEKTMRRILLDQVRVRLESEGILKPKNKVVNNEGEKTTGYKINRSALVEYEKKFSRPYEIPMGAVIIEDIIVNNL